MNPQPISTGPRGITATILGNKAVIHTRCPFCRTGHEIAVPTEQWANFVSWKLVQTAFPGIEEDDRERLISGICPSCWDQNFPVE